MLTITVPDEVRKMSEQVKQSCADGKGLVLIIGANQNWNGYMVYSILNLLKGDGDGMKKLVWIGGEDQYSQLNPIFTEIKDLTFENIVHGGAIRNKEKALDVLKASLICVVVCVIHADNVLERFADMEISKEEVEKSLRVVIQQEN